MINNIKVEVSIRINDLSGKKKLTADEQSVLTHKDELVQVLTLLDVKQQELQRQSALNDLKKKVVQLESHLKQEEQSQCRLHDFDLPNSGMGMCRSNVIRSNSPFARNLHSKWNNGSGTAGKKGHTARQSTARQSKNLVTV